MFCPMTTHIYALTLNLNDQCQFSFGLTPTEAMELEASKTPCLSRCPSSGGMRLWHTSKGGNPQCHLMDETEDTDVTLQQKQRA